MPNISPRPSALQVDWINPKRFDRDPVNFVELIGTGPDNTVASPLIYAGINKNVRMLNKSYTRPVAYSAGTLYAAFAGLDVSKASVNSKAQINATPAARNGLRDGQVRVSYRYGQGDQPVRSIVLDSQSAAGQAMLEAANNTRRDLFEFMIKDDPVRDGSLFR